MIFAFLAGMGRRTRLESSDLHYHVIVRCNNKSFRFQAETDFLLYLKTLRLVKRKHGIKIFNYEIMSNHVHLFLQPGSKKRLSQSMHLLNWKYANDYNRRTGRHGHLWWDRYINIPVQSNVYALKLMRYINRNPVRAGITTKAGGWRWSGYHALAGEMDDSLITFHPTYLALGSNPEERQSKYAQWVEGELEEIEELKFSEANYLGSDEFGEELRRLLRKPKVS